MIEVPTLTDVTNPVPNPMVATVVLLLTHVPPPTPFVSVDAVPRQIPVAPPMTVGDKLTVIVVVA
jgi:hypothetical protein